MTRTSLGLILPCSTASNASCFAVEDAGGAGVVEALVAGDLDDAAVGREIAAQDDEAAGGLERLVPVVDDDLAGSFDGGVGFGEEALAADGGDVFQRAALFEALREEARAAGLLIVLRGVLAAGREVADEGRAVGDLVEVFEREIDAELVRDGDEMEHGVGAAAGCGDGGDGVLECLASEDVARLDLLAREVHDHAAGFAAGGVFFFAHCGDAGELDGRDAEELAGHGHGVGGELAAAGAGAGAGCGFDGFELVVVDAAGRVRADGFEDGEDGDLFVGAVGLMEHAGRDAAAVEHEAGDVEARERHDGGGHVLVAAGDADEAVEGVGARDELDASRR